MTTTTTTTSYTKLRNGDWGLRAPEATRDGEILNVTKKSGERKTETVGTVIWRGNGVALCTIASTQDQLQHGGRAHDNGQPIVHTFRGPDGKTRAWTEY
jgi:hypothetical protein